MHVIYWIISGLLCVAFIIFITGLLLPKERIVTRRSEYNVSPEILYSIVTNNEDWEYRSELKNLIIIEKNGEKEIWDEVSNDGNIIRFRTKEKIPYRFYSFTMESKIFSDYWTATFEKTDTGGTLFTATEHIQIKNPFIKTLSYLFFNIGKYMDNYQQNLKNKCDSVDK